MRLRTVLLTALTLAAAVPCVQAQTFDWSGAYLGVNAGAVVNHKTRFDQATAQLPNNTTAVALGLRPYGAQLEGSGFLGGAQIGYNFDPSVMGDMFGGHMVLGAEADVAYTDLDQTNTASNTTLYGPLDTLGTTPTTRVNTFNSELKYLGPVRGRLGWSFDNMLVYGTGGFAYGDARRRITFYGPNANTTPFFQGGSNGMKTGSTYGGGVEWAIPTESAFNMLNFFHSSAVTLKIEYLHYDLGSDTLNYPGVNGGAALGGYTSRVRTDGDLVRAGVNYKM